MKTPRTERIACQIWWLIQQTGGDCTVYDMAELTGESARVCSVISSKRGWSHLHRRIKNDLRNSCSRSNMAVILAADEALDDLGRFA